MQNTLDELRTTTETLMDEQQQLRSENCEMRRQLELNEIEIDKLKQETLRKTLEISNVPVTEGEDLFGIVAQICQKGSASHLTGPRSRKFLHLSKSNLAVRRKETKCLGRRERKRNSRRQS
uniref:(northern house mosquito) hypothetical protein n=1 Tax=Culex pipiens TaxID=7175 RepID=A0A8D8CKD0_CULPI